MTHVSFFSFGGLAALPAASDVSSSHLTERLLAVFIYDY